MMGLPSCEEVARRATDYLEKALPVRKSLAMKLHMMMCKPCQGFVASLRKVAELSAILRPEGDRQEDEKEVDRLLGEYL